ncbi:OB-fold domain-containing protein [Mycobacterium sp. CVI_P3]|uniref:OB-fold domain-containing protein n=1 Tax=Mycobacterium pinniadriaticum TaxID=2994102 RepID=A0ABT3SBF1_9MYCO|nr:OB-fold domain-containing protein [Mycobacterium pinniadriaticum]MCX2929877.1 OB-fold domain-containing protein [Mycobacterium pinniadriaticum]MCX2936474.1 OB-fold domain-containing protein [Mycobacterium pinniadriaticum]
MPTQLPIVDYLVLDDEPHLRAHCCDKCQALYFDRRNACAGCGGTSFGWRDLSNTGELRAFTIVHRAAPSVKTPYVSAVVALDDGGMVKANLVDVAADPADIDPVRAVELTTWVVDTDDDGVEAVAFGYRPQGDAR